MSRWIAIQEPGQAEPDNPAPLLTLKPGPSGAAATAAVEPSAQPSAEPTAVTATSPAPVAVSSAVSAVAVDSGGPAWWIWVILAVLLVLALIVFQVRRSRTRT